mmetsp:Transcript_13311/g.24979  ORF Transcript_13311/g.24979 Transcript_13311/m.24979 type:complete len:1405 (-) Transcript_13311:159-4373(-)|eukprot:CAMPEP_0176497506 /NCGR_PEP_ID=MMETSP0200_2-20121128/11758_1 /TAXON_ID=947934 /ORGANISM="Chaetoceros sp., Strain GSL56" /LENGTH=1404 /DNA_ID=CAMNT_0017895519 /DNA_START=128 /DNA_END=4342 /DNA_ORIENTATION=+
MSSNPTKTTTPVATTPSADTPTSTTTENQEKPKSFLKRAAEYLFFGSSSSSSQNKRAKLSPAATATASVTLTGQSDSDENASAAVAAASDNAWVSPLARDSNATATRDSENTFQNGDNASAHEAVNLSSQKERVPNESNPSLSFPLSSSPPASRGEFPSFSIGSSSSSKAIYGSSSGSGKSTIALNRTRIQFASSVKPAPAQGSSARIRMGTPYHDGRRKGTTDSGDSGSSNNLIPQQRVRTVTFSSKTPLSDATRRRQYYKTPIKTLEQQYHDHHADGYDDVEEHVAAKDNSAGVKRQLSSSYKKQYKATSRILSLPAGISVSALTSSFSSSSSSSVPKLSCISAQAISTVASKILEKQSSRYTPKKSNDAATAHDSEDILFRDPTVLAKEHDVMGIKRVYGSHQTGSRVDSIFASANVAHGEDYYVDSDSGADQVGNEGRHEQDHVEHEEALQSQQEEEEEERNKQQQHTIKKRRVTFSDTVPLSNAADDMEKSAQVQGIEQKRMPREDTPHKRMPEREYVSLDNDVVDYERGEHGRTIYPAEYVYGVKLELGMGSNGVLASDVSRKVLAKRKNGELCGHIKFSRKKKIFADLTQRTDRNVTNNVASKVPFDFMPKAVTDSRKGSSSILNKPLAKVLAVKSAGGSDFGVTVKANEKTSGGITEPYVSVASSQSTAQDNASSTNGWGNLFASEPGLWKCDVCYIKNKKELDKCISCEAQKPSSADKNKVSSKVSNAPSTSGAAQTSSTGTFKFGASDSTKKDGSSDASTSTKFSFGGASTSVVTPSTGGFSFGTGASKPSNEEMETGTGAKGGFVFGFSSKPDEKLSNDSTSAEKGPTQQGTGSFSFGTSLSAPPTASDGGKGVFTFGGDTKPTTVPEVERNKSSTVAFTFGTNTSAASGGDNEKGDIKRFGGFVFGEKSDSGLLSEKSQSTGTSSDFAFGAAKSFAAGTGEKMIDQQTSGSFSFAPSTNLDVPSDAKSDVQTSKGGFSFGAATKQHDKNGENSNKIAFTFGASASALVSDVKTFSSGFNNRVSSVPALNKQNEPASSAFGKTSTDNSTSTEIKSDINKIGFASGSELSPQGGETKTESAPKSQFSFGSASTAPTASVEFSTDKALGSSAPKAIFAFGSMSSSSKSDAEKTISFGEDGPSNKKRPVDESISQSAPAPKFTFGASPSAPTVSSTQSFAFGVNKVAGPPPVAETKSSLLSFGASGTASSIGAPAPSAGFTFGSSAPSAPASTAMTAQAPAPSTGFSFGSTQAPSQSSTFAFGSTSAPAPTPASSTFSFGANNGPAQSTVPFGASSISAPSPVGGFSFGQSQGTVGSSFGQTPAPPAFGGFGTQAPAPSTAPSAQPQFGAPPAGQPNIMFGGAQVPGGGFSIGSDGGGNKNKGGRRIIRAKRPPAR